MKILITGGSGYLGRALTRHLRTQGHEVAALGSKDADLTREGTLEKFSGPFDRIYHLAAWTQAGDFSLRHMGDQWLINQAINTNVLRWWWRHHRQTKLVTIGTSCSYADNSPCLEESTYLDGHPLESLFTYGMTKRMLYIGQRSLERQYGMKWMTFIPSTLYGPGYEIKHKIPHFIFDITRKILEFKHGGAPVVLWGDGHQRRELVFVDDFVFAMSELTERMENELVNLGAGEEQSIREFAGLVCAAAGVDPAALQYDTTRYVGAKSKKLDTKKVDRLLPGWRRTPLRDGITQMVQWMEATYFGAAAAQK